MKGTSNRNTTHSRIHARGHSRGEFKTRGCSRRSEVHVFYKKTIHPIALSALVCPESQAPDCPKCEGVGVRHTAEHAKYGSRP